MTYIRKNNDSGFTLIELIAYFFIVAIILNITVKTGLSGKRIHDLGELAMTRMDSLRDIESDFRHAVTQSQMVYPASDEFNFGPDAFALASRGAEDDLEIFLWRRTDDGFLIYEVFEKNEDTISIMRRKKYAVEVTGFDIHALPGSNQHAKLLEFQLGIKNEGMAHVVPAKHRLVARLQGEFDDE